MFVGKSRVFSRTTTSRTAACTLFSAVTATTLTASVFTHKMEDKQPSLIKTDNWFSRITGFSEKKWREFNGQYIKADNDGNLIIENPKTQTTWNAGAFTVETLGEMAAALPPQNKEGPPVEFEIITRADRASTRFVDVAHLQALQASRNAVFQAASNFNGVEAISEGSKPDASSFTENYVYDLTQGPAASISAGAGAITRVHAAFYNPSIPSTEWTQTKDRQVNFLSELAEHFPIQNGYVVMTGHEPDFPSESKNPAERAALLAKTKIGYHKNTQVTTGHRNGGSLEAVDDPAQVMDQVFCAAVNLSQGWSGMANARSPNAQSKASFILDSAYQGTYLGAIKNERKHIYLTLIGGGVFGNRKSSIHEAIIKAHLRWGNNVESKLEKVSLVLFSSSDIYEPFARDLKTQGIPFKWIEYRDGQPVVILSNPATPKQG